MHSSKYNYCIYLYLYLCIVIILPNQQFARIRMRKAKEIWFQLCKD